MRRILTIAAALAVSSAAAVTAAASQAMTVATPHAITATQSQTPSGRQNAAFSFRWTPWGRRCGWGPGWPGLLGLAAALWELAALGLAALVRVAAQANHMAGGTPLADASRC